MSKSFVLTVVFVVVASCIAYALHSMLTTINNVVAGVGVL